MTMSPELMLVVEAQSPLVSRVKRWILPVLPFALLILIWGTIVAVQDPAVGVLPSPLRVLRAPFSNGDQYLTNVEASLRRLAWGFTFAAITGILVGIFAGLSKPLATFLGPLTAFMNSISGIAWIPLAVAWFGVGTGMVVFIIWNAAFFLVFANTMLGVRLVPKVLGIGLRTLGASRTHIVIHATIPGAMPYIMSGLRSGLGFAWRAVIAAELVGASSGLGFWIFEQKEFSRMDNIMAGALTIGVIGMAMDRFLLAPLERRTIERWGLVGTSS
jgi:ABC-type nitrate/sulfonate/bicarbonate transport system permease component